MRRKLLAFVLAIVLIACATAIPAAAETTFPSMIDAPEHFAASHYQLDFFTYTFSAPDDLRTLIDNFDPRKALVIKAQLDYKLGNGDWHYNSTWDTAKYTLKNTVPFSYIKDSSYISSGRNSLSSMFPEDEAALKPIKDSGWNIPSLPLAFRIRFVTSFDGQTYVYSDWSETYVYSKDAVKNPDTLINHAPTLVGAEIKKNTGGQPILYIRTGRQPGEAQDLNAMTGNGMGIEIWLRKAGDADFKKVGENAFRNEYIPVDVTRYFDQKLQSYEAESYEIKIRYVLNDLRKYPQCGRSEIIFSPFSNVYSQNMPAWSQASNWAVDYLKQAETLGIIPEIIRGKNMSAPITREEFAEIAVKFYEKVTGKTAQPANKAFLDCTNPEVLKAYGLNITAGVGDGTKFEPDGLLMRQQMAAMITRTLKACFPNVVFDITGQPDFKDQKSFASYAIDPAKFMAKHTITVGDGKGSFDPVGNCTREQALTFLVKSFNFKDQYTYQ